MANFGKTALITGASSGIGYEFTRLFAKGGYDLVLVARSEKQLRELAKELEEKFGVSVKIIVKDLSQASAPGEVFNEVELEGITVDALVNNAGFATSGMFAEIDLEAELQEMQLNMVTLTHLTKLFLGGMLQRRRGKILNVASTAAFQPGPLMAVYYATKAYVLSFSEALANELRGTGVTVTALCPGATASGFQERAGIGNTRLISGRKIMDSARVARVGYRALMRGKTVVIPGFMNKLLAEMVRFAPRKVVTQAARYAQENVNKK